MRSRNAILEAIELLRDGHPSLTLAQIIAFLHVADGDEPTPLPDLQFRAELSPVQAWRAAKTLEADAKLITLTRWKTRNTLAIALSPAGHALCTRLDVILKRATPVAPRPVKADAA